MSSPPYAVYEYEDENGYSEFREWRLKLRRSNPQASAKVDWLIDLLEDKGTSLQFPYVSHIGDQYMSCAARQGVIQSASTIGSKMVNCSLLSQAK